MAKDETTQRDKVKFGTFLPPKNGPTKCPNHKNKLSPMEQRDRRSNHKAPRDQVRVPKILDPLKILVYLLREQVLMTRLPSLKKKERFSQENKIKKY